MRNLSFAFLVVFGTSGCASLGPAASSSKLCGLDAAWREIDRPSNRQFLLQVEFADKRRKSVLDYLNERSDAKRREAWFESVRPENENRLILCTFHPVKDECLSNTQVIMFTRGAAGWTAEHVLEPICVS